MQTQRKLTFTFISIIATAILVLIAIVSFGFYNFSKVELKEKTGIVAELVKDGLTAHMVNGIMENREFFLKHIENSKNIDELWIARSPSVIKQYGSGYNNEIPRDKIDQDVIQTGVVQEKMYGGGKFRFTVPYIATSYGNPNCLSCHIAQEGETLGSISMIFDTTEMRNSTAVIIIYILLVSIIVVILAVYSINRSLNPIWRLFDSINNVMKYAHNGDYSKRVDYLETEGDTLRVAKWINSFLDKLENTLNNIQENVKDFFVSYTHDERDLLLDTKKIIFETSNIFRFKRTIEFDETKGMLYERLATVLRDYLHLESFAIFETDNEMGTMSCVYGFDKNQTLDENVKHRALRTQQYVSSDQFTNVCFTNDERYKHYLCIPYSINENLDLLIHFTFSNDKSLQKAKKVIPQIENYIDSARPELVSKNLTEILRRSSTVDQLTGLYNRKFLDEFIHKTAPQAIRSNSNYGILMLDIDFFKAANDEYGHDIGDLVIKALSKLMLSSIRDSDVAFRYGGEEFLIMLYNCDDEKIYDIADKIRITFSNEVIYTNNKESFSKTLSIGYANFPSDSDNIRKCIKLADVALYRAKNSGRNKVLKFEPYMLDKED